MRGNFPRNFISYFKIEDKLQSFDYLVSRFEKDLTESVDSLLMAYERIIVTDVRMTKVIYIHFTYPILNIWIDTHNSYSYSVQKFHLKFAN